jgi:uncharacterized membrane protein HdeD (DUF308 family)
MAENTTLQRVETRGPCNGPCPPPIAKGSMATMCNGMLEKLPSCPWLMLPGALLVVVGVLILVQPGILVWLAGTITVLLGVMLLVMAKFMRQMGARLRNT